MMPGMPADPATAEPIKRVRRSRGSEPVRAMDLDWSTIPRGVWLWAGTSADEPYPCMCQPWMALNDYTWCGGHCPCRGRNDTAHLPEGCCALPRRGRRQTTIGAPVPLPPASQLRRTKLRPPAPVTVADVLAAIVAGG